MMTKKELKKFKKMFRKYCKEELYYLRCLGMCECCPVQDAYNRIFGNCEEKKTST